jgi:hypothetical protein
MRVRLFEARTTMPSSANSRPYSDDMDTVLLILAVICFLIAAFNVKLGTVSFGWLGLALYVITALTA